MISQNCDKIPHQYTILIERSFFHLFPCENSTTSFACVRCKSQSKSSFHFSDSEVGEGMDDVEEERAEDDGMETDFTFSRVGEMVAVYYVEGF